MKIDRKWMPTTILILLFVPTAVAWAGGSMAQEQPGSKPAGSCIASGTLGFSDVPVGSYYEDAVRWLLSEGITSGTSPGKFSPAAPVTRAQMAVFLYRNTCGATVPPGELKASAGNATVFLEWKSVLGAVDYLVESAPSSTGPWSQVSDDVSTETQSVQVGVVNGTAAWFRVRSVNPRGTPSSPSNSVSATPLATGPTCGRLTKQEVWSSGTLVKGCDVVVPANTTLTVLEGARFKGSSITVEAGGVLRTIEGPNTGPVFTSRCDTEVSGGTSGSCTDPEPVPWALTIMPYGSASLRGADLRFVAINAEADATLTVRNSSLKRAIVSAVGGSSSVSVVESLVEDSSFDVRGVVSLTGSTFRRSAIDVVMSPSLVVTGNVFEDSLEPGAVDAAPRIALRLSFVPDVSLVEGNQTVGVGVQRLISAENGSSVAGEWNLDPFEDAVFMASGLNIVDGGTLNVGARSLLKVSHLGIDVGPGGTLNATGTDTDPAVIQNRCDTYLLDADYAAGSSATCDNDARGNGNWPGLNVEPGATAELDHAHVRQMVLSTASGSVSVVESLVEDSSFDVRGVVSLTGSTFRRSAIDVVMSPSLVVTGNVFEDSLEPGAVDAAPRIALRLSFVPDVSLVEGNQTVGVGVQRLISAENGSSVAGEWNLDPFEDAVFMASGLNIVDGGTLNVGARSLLKVSHLGIDVGPGGTLNATGTDTDPAVIQNRCDTYLLDADYAAGSSATCDNDGPGEGNHVSIQVLASPDGPSATADLDHALMRWTQLEVFGRSTGDDGPSVTVEDSSFLDSPLFMDNVDKPVLTRNQWLGTNGPIVMTNLRDLSGVEPDNELAGSGPTQRTMTIAESKVAKDSTWTLGPTTKLLHSLSAVEVSSSGTMVTDNATVLLSDWLGIQGTLKAERAAFEATSGTGGQIRAEDGSKTTISSSSFSRVEISANYGCSGDIPVYSTVSVMNSDMVHISNCISDGLPPYPLPTASGNTGNSYSSHQHTCVPIGEPPRPEAYIRIWDVDWESPNQVCPIGYIDAGHGPW